MTKSESRNHGTSKNKRHGSKFRYRSAQDTLP